MELVSSPLHFGHIICKCNLVDCMLMSKEFVEDIRQNFPQEYICGEYAEGRYAWILEDITPLSQFIPIKGHLGIWNF